MLVILPHGVCVDPEIVKYVTIRTDRPSQPNAKLVFSVVMKTDADDHLQVIGSFDDRDEAEALSLVCAKRINKGLGVETEDESSSSSDDDMSLDDDASSSSDDDDDFDFKLDD